MRPRIYIIYVITNLINGKKYFGQTSSRLCWRWSDHKSQFRLGAKRQKLYKAMEKHGVENFVIEPVCYALDKDSLNDLEVHFIKEYDTMNLGYNMTPGGKFTYFPKKENKQRNLKNTFRSEAVRLSWETRRQKEKENPGVYKDPKEYVAKGRNHPMSKRYLVTFPCGKEEVIQGLGQFCREHGLDEYEIFAIFRGEQQSHRGYKVRRFDG